MTVLLDDDPRGANWISIIQKEKGRPIPLPPPSQPVALGGTPAEMAYSPGQKRDSVGRFGSGGGKSAPTGGAGTAGETPEGEAGRKAILAGEAKTLQGVEERLAQSGMPWDRLDAQVRAGQVLKAQAMREVGADLDAQFDRNRLASATLAMRDTGMNHGDTPGEQMADAMLSTWQQGAYGLDKPSTVALQIATAQEFKVGVGKSIELDFRGEGRDVDAWPSTLGYDVEVMRASVRSMYNHTQAHLDDLGVGPTVTLHRGVGRAVRGDVDVDFNAASSWSTSRITADSFAQSQSNKHFDESEGGTADQTGTRLTMTVDRKRILAVPGHGIGCYEEGEAVVLRAEGDRANAVEPGLDYDQGVEP